MTAANPVSESGQVISVNLAHVMPTPGPPPNGPVDRKPTQTGIDKRPVTESVAVRRLGLVGDSICDTANHGGPDQAVYAYAESDTAWWQAELADELAFTLRPGSLGENLTLRGVELTHAVIGERWRIGSVVLQVTAPRIPCSTFAGYWKVDRLAKRFIEAARPGAYLRVLTEGELRVGDPVTVLDRPPHGLTIRQTLQTLTGDRRLAPELLAVPELPQRVHDRLGKWLAASPR